jgi:hypothetical protein
LLYLKTLYSCIHYRELNESYYVREKVVAFCFEELYQHLKGRPEENNEIIQS